MTYIVMLDEDKIWNTIVDIFCLDEKQQYQCPRCELIDDVIGIVLDLNDNHRWSFSRIADWLETTDGDNISN